MSDLLCGAFLLLFIQASTSFTQKRESVCHSLHECGNAQLTCDPGQRLAMLKVSHSHHLNISNFSHCPSAVQNCSTVPDVCCKKLVIDCVEDYPAEVLLEAHENCSAKMSRFPGNVTCDLELPPFPVQSKGRCSTLPAFQTMSSYSTVDYACVNESDVAPLCVASHRQGNLLYALWTLGQSFVNSSDVNVTSCRCRVTSASVSPVTVFVRALDVRLSKSKEADECSYVTVTDSVTTRLNTTCSNGTTILFDTTSQGSVLASDEATPIDITLSMHLNNMPDIVWIGFTGINSKDLTITCYDPGQGTALDTRQTHSITGNGDATSPPVTAAVVGGLAAVIVVVVAVFICFKLVGKRRHASKGPKTRSWWDKTREEDRIAELSQLGMASKVIVDTGRHMGYGKHPPTRRKHRTADDNPPIFIVPGSAVSQITTEAEIVNDSDASNLHGQTPGASANNGGHSEAKVLYSASAGSNPVVLITEGCPPTTYDIPKLTIKELD